MNSDGPVVIIEDDVDDKEVLEEVFQNLNIPINCYSLQVGNQLLIFQFLRCYFLYYFIGFKHS